MACYINPFPNEISQDEYLLILNTNNLYDTYLNIINNGEEGLLEFFNINKAVIDKGINQIKELRDFKAGKLTSTDVIINNPIINYFINNNINSNILKTLDKSFTEIFYKLANENNKPVSDFININDLFKLPYQEGVKSSNVLIRFLGSLNGYKNMLSNQLTTGLNNNNEVLTEYDKIYIQQTINYINSLGVFKDLNYPIISLENFKNNLRLKELINYLGRDGLFKLDNQLVEDLNNEKEDLENNIQIYEKDPLTEDPSDKISARLKLMLRGINMYDSSGNKVIKSNIELFWKPADLIQKMLIAVSNNNVHNLTIDQILDKLTVLSTQEFSILSQPISTFLKRLNALKTNNNLFNSAGPDIYTDLFLYFQQYPVGIKVLETETTIFKNKPIYINGIEVIEDIEVKSLKIQNKVDYVNAGLNRVRKDIFNNLLNSSELQNNFNTKNELILASNQSVAQLAEIIATLLSPSLTTTQKNIKEQVFNKIKQTDLKNGINFLTVLEGIINGDNILNSSIINKVYNINNDTLFPVLSPSELSEELSIINSSIAAIKNGVAYEDTDFYKKFNGDIISMSLWADYVKNASNPLSLSIFIGHKLDENIKEEYSDFTQAELLANLFNVISSGSIPTPILSDKSNIYLIDNYSLNQGALNQLNFRQDPISYFKYFISYLKIDNELNEQINNGINIGKNIDKAIAKQKLILFNPAFYEIADNEEVLEIYNTYVNGDTENKQTAEKQLIDIINKYQTKLGNDLYQKFIDTKLITYNDDLEGYYINSNLLDKTIYLKTKAGVEQLKNNIKEVAVKYYVLNTQVKLLSVGHSGFFKENDEQKRVKAIAANSKKVNLNATYKNKQIITKNSGKRIILKDIENPVVNKIAEDFFLQRLKEEKFSNEDILKKMANLFSNYTLLDGTPVYSLNSAKLDKIKEEFNIEAAPLLEKINTLKLENNLEEVALIQEDYNKILTKYSNLEKEIKFLPTKKSNTTDASSVSSLDFSKKYHVGLNMYSDNQEEAYNAELNGNYLNKFTENNFKVIKNIVYTKTKSKNSDILLPYMEKTSTDNFTAQRVFLGEEPNLYQAMIGKMFGYTFNEKNESWTYNPNNAIIDKIVYESAVKAEMPVNQNGDIVVFDLLKEIENKNIKSLEDVNNWKPEQNFEENYVIDIPITEDRLQVETPEHLEGQADIGTQIEGLISNGIDADSEFVINNKTFNGLELTNLLNQLRVNYVDKGENDLYNEFFKEDRIYDLVASLYNDREYLNLETLTPEKLPDLLSNPQFGLALVSKIQSLIKQNVVKTKINGIQFFNGVVANDKSLNILVEDVIDANGKTIKKLIFEVAVPAFSENMFKAALNSETGKLDVNLIPEELREFVVYRIPTEAMYSMFAVRIKKLLHPSSGPIIYMPEGPTNIAGFDMDIDKLFGIVKNYYSKDNKLIPISYSLEKDSNINFKEWIKENITDTDQLTLNDLFLEKSNLIEKNPDLFKERSDIKKLKEEKNKIISDLEKDLIEEYDLSGKQLSTALSRQLKNYPKYLEIKETLNTFYDSIKIEENESLKNSVKEINKQINDIYAIYKDSWKNLNVAAQLSTSQYQNLYLDIIKGVVTNEKSVNEYITGNGFQRLEDINTDLENRNTSKESKKDKLLRAQNPYRDANLVNSLNTFRAIMSGAQNIGPAAIYNQFVALNQFLKNFGIESTVGFNVKSINLLSKNQKDTEQFNIFKGLNNYVTKSGLKPNMAIAELLAQAVDNIKKDLSVPLNLQKQLVGLRSLLYITGLDENIVDRIFTDYPLVDKIIKESIESDDINRYKNNIFKYNLYDLSEKPSKFIFLDKDEKININLELLNKKFKPGNLVSDILSSDISEEEIVYFLHEMLELANELSDIINTINYYQKGLGKNFASLIFSYDKTKQLLNSTLSNNFSIDLSNSFIEYKLQKLVEITENIYSNFNINLEDPNFNFFKQYFQRLNNSKYLGYLFNANLSSNLYLNLLAEFGSAENLKKAYFKEVSDLKLIFGQNTIIEKTGDNYVKSDVQNLNLNILNSIIRFVDNNPFFEENIKNITILKQLYPFDIQFLGQSESFNSSLNPKNIIDIMSIDNKTLYYGGNQDIITEDNVFSAQEITQKLFFINMVQSGLFSGKNNKGRSNVFDLLFLDNIILQNFLLYINKPYSYLLNNSVVNPEILRNSSNVLSAYTDFILLNNPEGFNKYTRSLEDTYLLDNNTKKLIKNIFVNSTPITLNNNYLDVYVIDKSIILPTDDPKKLVKLGNFLNSTYITFNDNGSKKLFKLVYSLGNNLLYKNLGIIGGNLLSNEFSGKINPIAFNFLDEVISNLGITRSNIESSDVNLANQVIGTWSKPAIQTPVNTTVETISTPQNPIKIYSDGSDIKGTGKVGFGAVYEYNNKEYALTGTEEGFEVKDLQKMFPEAKFSNPTMEMLALVRVLQSFSNNSEHLSIYQDYKGAVNYNELWNYSEGSQQRESKPWNAKESYIKYLVAQAVDAIKKIETNGGSVKINWVKGHAGNKMNDRADFYAKSRENFNNLTEPLSKTFIEPTTQPSTDVKTKQEEQSKLFQLPSTEGQVASEKTIRDLAARMSDRIGMPVKFESDRTKQYKGKIENNIAYVNLAYATLDTPIHEILGHPIIRAIKGKNKGYVVKGSTITDKATNKTYIVKEVTEDYDFVIEENGKDITVDSSTFEWNTNAISQLYQNLLKELEYGKGKEVLDRIKRDYKEYEKNLTAVKSEINRIQNIISKGYLYEIDGNLFNKKDAIEYSIDNNYDFEEEIEFDSYANLEINLLRQQQILEEKNSVSKSNVAEDFIIDDKEIRIVYNLEKVQEEAIVELLGMMTAEKLDNVKDGKLISLLKRLLKEMKQFIRSLINQKEVEIDKLPDNMTINDLADLLAYSNSKLILPGYEVEYTTPDNMKFKTYQEASNHISQLAKNVKDVDLDNISLLKEKPKYKIGDYFGQYEKGFVEQEGLNKIETQEEADYLNSKEYRLQEPDTIKNFIEKNKEYEQSKEIIEEWKKVNNIQYNPEEIYSRGQEFVSVLGAYSDFDVNLMMQNLLQHIEDNEKAGGKFVISAFTKPVDKTIGHLEGGGGKIKFKIYPQSNDILWAANTDVYSGSVWDASEKINKDKKSELLGVSYTKYPSLYNVGTVQPNLASVVDNLAHHHNELGIALTGNNFRLEYDEDIPYTTKKIIEGINKILDQKYGKLVNPEIKKVTIIPNEFEFWQQDMNEDGGLDRFRISIFKKDDKWFEEFFDTYGESESVREIDYNEVKLKFDEALSSNSTLTRGRGIQPTQTKDNLKESIESVKSKVTNEIEDSDGIGSFGYDNNGIRYVKSDDGTYSKSSDKFKTWVEITEEEYESNKPKRDIKQKEYISQALINTKIAALKEVAKKYPRSLIRSEVKPVKPFDTNSYEQFNDELPFQKILSTEDKFFIQYIKEEALKNNIDLSKNNCK
jgi:ribonuclease HI